MHSHSLRLRLMVLATAAILAVVINCPPHAVASQLSTHRFSNLAEIESITFTSRFDGFQSAVDRDLTDGQPAYDYSTHLIKDVDLGAYRLYSGGRWKSAVGDGDHVLQYDSPTGLGGTWQPRHDPPRPEFPQGQEEGFSGEWFSRNYLEPEVMKVDGTYYMYTQVQIRAGDPIDIPGQIAERQADRIQLHTSSDGDNWTRWSEDGGVIVNVTEPTRTNIHHQEVVYVPWDADGKPYWMYVAVNEPVIATVRFTGHHRIRSADPTTFDWGERQRAFLPQLGNQIGYIEDAPGGPLMVRIFFAKDETGRAVPALRFSLDGISWFGSDEGDILLDGSKDELSNKNSYFLGISTLDGLGQIEQVGNNLYHAIYSASTSNTPVAPAIFASEVGVGELYFRLNLVPEPSSAVMLVIGLAGFVAVALRRRSG
jgi:hypothetical protein